MTEEEDNEKTIRAEDGRRKPSSVSFLSEIRKRRKHGNVSLAPANVRTPFVAIPTIARIVGGHLKKRKDSILLEIGYGDGRILIGCCEILGCHGIGFEISSEERQRALKRLEIARALASEPDILLLDEPAAGLNRTETDALRAVIRKIADKGITVVLVEHDMKLVMSISDQVLVLCYGRQLADGTPDEIRANPDVIDAYLGSRKPEEEALA